MFEDRQDAGRQLAAKLRDYDGPNTVVYGLPRGGVPVACAVAEVLCSPLDIIVARKIGHPQSPEYGIGAVSEDGNVVWNEEEAKLLSLEWREKVRDKEFEEARRRRSLYVGDGPKTPVEGKVAILVDDGIATGYTMLAALNTVRDRNPSKVIVAAPVAPVSTAQRFRGMADEVVLVGEPTDFFAIGQFYEDFGQLTDDDVLRFLANRMEHAMRG